MNLDPCTFGDTPAALYLVDVLNELDDLKLSRKLGKIITNVRRVCHQLYNSQVVDMMDVSTVNMLGNMLRGRTTEAFIELLGLNSAGTAGDQALARLAINLAANICAGEFKSLLRCGQELIRTKISHEARARYLEREKSITPPKVQFHLTDFTDDITPASLRDKSRKKLKKAGKISRLY